MTNKEKLDNARKRMVEKLVDNILVLAGACDVVQGPRGNELLELMRRETSMFITDFEEMQIKRLFPDGLKDGEQG